MLLYLHRNLAGLAGLAAKQEHARFSGTAALRVLDQQNGLYRVEATDGRRLAIVQGPVPSESYQRLADDNELTEVLVSRDDWTKAFRLGDKSRPVGLAAGADEITLAVGDQALVTKPVEGRYPNTAQVILGTAPLFTLRVDPRLLSGLLDMAAAMDPEGGVALHFYGNAKLLGLSARNDQGQAFDALLVPLTATT